MTPLLYIGLTKPARDFRRNDIIRYPKPRHEHGGLSYRRYRIVEYIGIGRYGYDYKVEDLETKEVKWQGFGSQTRWIVEES